MECTSVSLEAFPKVHKRWQEIFERRKEREITGSYDWKPLYSHSQLVGMGKIIKKAK